MEVLGSLKAGRLAIKCYSCGRQSHKRVELKKRKKNYKVQQTGGSMKIEIWTDGSCHPNPGNGSWAFVLIHKGELLRECSGWEEGVTNNRMEYQAVIEAFRYLESEKVPYTELKVCSDSELLVKTINDWMHRWKSNGWRRASKTNRGTKYAPVANLDLVKELYEIKDTYEFDIEWVKGHSDLKWNEHCDQLCTKEFNSRGLKSFEQIREEKNLRI